MSSSASARPHPSLAIRPIRELAIDIIHGEPITSDRLRPDLFAKSLYGSSNQRNVKRLVTALRGELLDQMGGSAAGWEGVSMRYMGKRERSMVLQILSGLPEEERRRAEKRKRAEQAGRTMVGKRRKAGGKGKGVERPVEVPLEVPPQSNNDDDDERVGTGVEANIDGKLEEKENTPDEGKRKPRTPQGEMKKPETPGSEQEATGIQTVQNITRAQRKQMRNDFSEMIEQMLLGSVSEHQWGRPPPKRLVLIILRKPLRAYVLRSQTPCSTASTYTPDDPPAIPAAVSDDAPVVSDLYPDSPPPTKRKRTAPPTPPSPPRPRNYPRRTSRTTSTSTPTPSSTPQPLPWLTPPATPPSSSLKSFHTALRSLSSALNIAVETMPPQWQEALVYETRHAWPLEPTLLFLSGVVQDSLNGVAVTRSIGRRTPPKMPVDVQEEDLRDYGTLQRFAELVGEMEAVVEAVMDLGGEWVRRVEGLGVDRGWRLEGMATMVMGVVASRTYGGVWGWAWKGLEGEEAG